MCRKSTLITFPMGSSSPITTMIGKEPDVSSEMKLSPSELREDSTMSATDDVIEMQELCGTLAEKLTRSLREKVRIAAIRAHVLGPDNKPLFGQNRVLEFLRGKARRIDSWEKDIVRGELRRIERAEDDARSHAFISRFRDVADGLRASDQRQDREDAAALERVLARHGLIDLAVAEAADAEEA